jgi:hypothetical protein
MFIFVNFCAKIVKIAHIHCFFAQKKWLVAPFFTFRRNLCMYQDADVHRNVHVSMPEEGRF